MSARAGRGRELALLALLALLWGSSYLFLKIAVTEIPPLTVIAIRVSIAALVLMTVLAVRGETLPRDIATWRMLFVQSFFTSIGAWTILAWGAQYVESSLASVLNSTSPIFVFFITLIVTRHESVGLLRFIGACLGLAGVVLIVGVDALQGFGQQVAGQLAAVAGALLYACAAIYGRRFTHMSAPVIAAGTMVAATAVLAPVSIIVDRPWTLDPSTAAIVSAVALGVFSTGFALLIYFRLVRTLGSLGVASQSYLRAGVGVLLGVAFLGERIDAAVAFGLAAAVLGVALINAPVSGFLHRRTRRPLT